MFMCLRATEETVVTIHTSMLSNLHFVLVTTQKQQIGVTHLRKQVQDFFEDKLVLSAEFINYMCIWTKRQFWNLFTVINSHYQLSC